ncbi:MAG: hypothetical protein JOZ47_03015 [Kutzneria sp.]|nr:hypothetical protein [Kutzneria sp.]MBV9844034.1 hypothetical protein [Kutzneria sp.]
MSEGRFVLHELRVPDVVESARFYAELFGWNATDTPVGKLLRAGDTIVGGVSTVKQNIPVHWGGYVAVTDVVATAAIAKEYGGIVTTQDGEPANAPGRGWVAPILDPDNKVVFLITEPRPAAAPEIGTFVWDRLHAADPAASAAFYQNVLPWTPFPRTDGAAGGFRLGDGTMVADMVPAGDGRPRWSSYVLVEDLDDARDRASGLGATVVIERAQFPAGSGDLCVLTDPQGAEIGLCQAS